MTYKAITLKQLAKTLNVSISTVSRALQDHPSIGLTTKNKVKNLAAKLHFEPNPNAVVLQTGKTHTIGVILPNISEPFFSELVSAIEKQAALHNYTILLAQSHESQQKEEEILKKMKRLRVDGLIISLSKETANYEHLKMLKMNGPPVVYVDRIPPIEGIHSVTCNIVTGTQQALNYLIQNGHRAIGMINGPPTLLASRERMEGYEKAFLRSRWKVDPSLLFYSDLQPESVESLTEKLLNHTRKVTAIVTFNDFTAFTVLRKFSTHPDPPVIVSYANHPLLDHLAFHPVASVEQYPGLQGTKATDLLIGIIDNAAFPGGYHITVESKVVIRCR